jgi:hypothetical protein
MFLGEGVAHGTQRLPLAFPPSFPFESYGLEDWVTFILGLYYLFLGLNPVHIALISFIVKDKSD